MPGFESVGQYVLKMSAGRMAKALAEKSAFAVDAPLAIWLADYKGVLLASVLGNNQDQPDEVLDWKLIVEVPDEGMLELLPHRPPPGLVMDDTRLLTPPFRLEVPINELTNGSLFFPGKGILDGALLGAPLSARLALVAARNGALTRSVMIRTLSSAVDEPQ